MILKELSEYKYTGDIVLKSKGTSELLYASVSKKLIDIAIRDNYKKEV